MFQPHSGFLALDVEDPRELVYGMAGFVHTPPPPLTTPQQFTAFASPGGIRALFNLRVVDNDGVVRVSTETRCLANGDEARRTFAGYWRLIYPGSAIIRRVWLDAIIARAERAAGTSRLASGFSWPGLRDDPQGRKPVPTRHALCPGRRLSGP